jgi:hypothetical protein
MTFYVPGVALALPASESGRLALVTIGGSKLLLYMVDDPITEQLLSTMQIVGR